MGTGRNQLTGKAFIAKTVDTNVEFGGGMGLGDISSPCLLLCASRDYFNTS
jgi:hypothetical protein